MSLLITKKRFYIRSVERTEKALVRLCSVSMTLNAAQEMVLKSLERKNVEEKKEKIIPRKINPLHKF